MKTNKTVGAILMMTILLLFIPYAINQYHTTLGPDYVLLLIPSISGAIAFCITGFIPFLPATRNPNTSKRLFILSLILLIFNAIFSVVIMPFSMETISLLIAIVFVISSLKQPTDKKLLIVNVCGLFLILFLVKTYFLMLVFLIASS